MTSQTTQIPVSSIILDETIYPRKAVDPRRVGMFAENIRDGIAFDPIEVEPCPDRPGFYRLLDGAHRWNAYKSTGMEEVIVIIKDLDGKAAWTGSKNNSSSFRENANTGKFPSMRRLLSRTNSFTNYPFPPSNKSRPSRFHPHSFVGLPFAPVHVNIRGQELLSK